MYKFALDKTYRAAIHQAQHRIDDLRTIAEREDGLVRLRVERPNGQVVIHTDWHDDMSAAQRQVTFWEAGLLWEWADEIATEIHLYGE